MPQKYLPVGGVATLVRHCGPTTLPGSPPATTRGEIVVCLHDAGDNGARFSALLEALEATHSPLTYDRPGHGRSGGLDSLGSVPAMVEHLRGLADGFRLGRPILVGEGLGAAIALEAAVTDPSWPKALVLTGGATAHATHLEPVVDELTRITQGKARRTFDNSGYAPDTPKEVYQKAFTEWVKTDPRATLGDRLAQQRWDGRGRLGAVTCPVTIVLGAHEDVAAGQAARDLAAELTSATVNVVTLAGAGRHGVLEAPEALAALIDSAAATAASTAGGTR